MRYVILVLFIKFIFINNLHSLENKIILKIENEIITSLDVENEIIYLEALNPSIKNLDREKSYTDFVTVRFGNVLGSTGSVIPLFQNQISRGGPLKVTHKEATRFFMSVKEAVELVLISLNSSINKKEKGDINVLEMGEPMKIDNLAKQLARLSGLTPGKDIKIIYNIYLFEYDI